MRPPGDQRTVHRFSTPVHRPYGDGYGTVDRCLWWFSPWRTNERRVRYCAVCGPMLPADQSPQPGTVTALAIRSKPSEAHVVAVQRLIVRAVRVRQGSSPFCGVRRSPSTLERLTRPRVWWCVPSRARLLVGTARKASKREQAHFPAEQPSAREDPRIPAAHAYQRRPRGAVRASRQGAHPPVGLRSPCSGPASGCDGGMNSRPRCGRAGVPVEVTSSCT